MENRYETEEYFALYPRKKRSPMAIETLQEKRHMRHYSQQELSRRTSIAQGDISKIERGKSNPSVLTLRRLADGLDCDLSIQFIPRESVTVSDVVFSEETV